MEKECSELIIMNDIRYIMTYGLRRFVYVCMFQRHRFYLTNFAKDEHIGFLFRLLRKNLILRSREKYTNKIQTSLHHGSIIYYLSYDSLYQKPGRFRSFKKIKKIAKKIEFISNKFILCNLEVSSKYMILYNFFLYFIEMLQ